MNLEKPVIIYWEDALIYNYKDKNKKLPLKMTIGKWFDQKGEFVILRNTTTYKFDSKDKAYLPISDSKHNFFFNTFRDDKKD
jgi:hypothetical protein